MLTCIVKLQDGEESYPLYKKEKDGLIDSLKRRAEMIEGVGLQPVFSCMHVYIDTALHVVQRNNIHAKTAKLDESATSQRKGS